MRKTEEQLREQLYAPLPSEAIKPHPTKTFLSTIKPIYVTDRLNEVFGIGNWQLRTENILVKDNGTVVNKVTFTVPEYNIYYECFGGNDNGGDGSKGFDLGDAFKGATTDGLTKICSYLGIGIDVFKGKQNSKTISPAPIPNTTIPKQQSTPANIVEYDKVGKALLSVIKDTQDLIVKQKDFKATQDGASFQSGASVSDVIKINHIDLVREFYKFITKK